MNKKFFNGFLFLFSLSIFIFPLKLNGQTFIEDVYGDYNDDSKSGKRPFQPHIDGSEEEFADDDKDESEVTRNSDGESEKPGGQGRGEGSADNYFGSGWLDASSEGENYEEYDNSEEFFEEDEIVEDNGEVSLLGGYHGLFAIPVDGSIGDLLHFENNSYFAPVGFFIEADYLNFNLFLEGDGFGIKGSWSRFSDEQEKYSFKMDYFTLDAFYLLNFILKDDLDVRTYGGGGIMFAKEPTFNYTSGFTPETYNWIYFQALIGCCVVKTFWENFTVNGAIDFAFPFGLKVIFPNFTFSFGCGWRFR